MNSIFVRPLKGKFYRIISIGLSLLLSPELGAFCQKGAPEKAIHASLLPGKKRSMVAYAGKDYSFTMAVAAREARASDVPGFISIDGQIVQSTLVPVPFTMDPNNLTPAREKEILTGYMNYELGYYKKKLKQHFSQLQTEWITIKGRLFLVWYFDMPKEYAPVSRQLYFSTLFFDQVLDLNVPVFKPEQFTRAKEVLVMLTTSLKTYHKQMDLKLLASQLHK